MAGAIAIAACSHGFSAWLGHCLAVIHTASTESGVRIILG
jgi:hypothetical protein